MQREGYWDYMGRKLREDRIEEMQKSLQNSFIKQKTLIERIDELNIKVDILGGDPNQLELKF